MRLATITNWAYGATVILSLASAATMLFASSVQDDERAAVAQRFRLDHASSDVAADVTLLSDQARDYVITGAASHLSIYRGAVSQLRSVEERTRRLKDLGASTDELSALNDAMRRADTLQDEQKEAVAARERGDEDQARRILFGPEYDSQLDRVATDVERFQYRLDQRTDAEVQKAASIAKIWKTCSEIVLALTGALVLCVLYFIFKRRVLHPVVRLSDVVNRLAAQDYGVEPPNYEHIDEIGDMAQAIRLFRENGIQRQTLENERSADLHIRNLLSRMTQRMQSCETVRDLEQVIVSFVPEIAPSMAGRLYLFDKTRNALVENCSWLKPVHSRTEFPPTACWALQRNELHRPAGNQIDVPCQHIEPSQDSPDTICLPLVAQRETLGLLYLERRADAVEATPETYLKLLAENISLSLGNLRLRDALREMAMADALTGLSNRRYLDTVLDVKIKEAEHLKQPISCLMLDVDHFKRFNDSHGHEAGDAVLRAMGSILKHSTRESDAAFRYGGEEFLLLMPGLDSEHALERAKAIQAKIRAAKLEYGGRDLGSITSSFGLATAPSHCSFDTIVRTADAALYRAKEAGRDRIEISEPRWDDRRVAG